MPEIPKTAFESYLQTFMRRKFTFLGVFLVCGVGLCLLAMAVKPRYQTTSRVAIADISKMPMPDFLDVYLPGASAMGLAGDTYVALLEGLPMADKVAGRLAEEGIFLDGKTVAFATTAEFFEPDLIEIAATAPDSLRAVALANAAAEVFVSENKDIIKRELNKAVAFIEEELDVAEQEWLDSQNMIASMRQKPEIGYIEQRISSLADQVVEFSKAYAHNRVNIEKTQTEMGELQRLLAPETTTRLNPMEDPVITGMRDKLILAESELALASGEFGAEHPEVMIKRARRDEISREIESRIQTLQTVELPVPDKEYYATLRADFASTQVSLITLQAERVALKGALTTVDEQLNSVAQVHVRYRRVQLQSSVAEEKYRSLMERLETSRIQIEGVQGNASVIDLAVDARPTTTRSKLMFYAVVLSLILGVGAVFVVEYLDDSLKSLDELGSAVGVTPLGAILRMRVPEQRLLAPDDQRSPLFESYRIVRSGIRFAAVNNPIRSLLITSAVAGEGKSSTAVNLGVVMAAGGQRVLLVDADLRNPTLHRLLGKDPVTGLTSVLLGEAGVEESLITTPYERLWVLPSGAVPPNPVELFESENMRKLIRELDAFADVVIFDSAPVLPVTDAALLAGSVDAVVMVMAAGQVSTEDARNAKRILDNSGARVIGAILNKVRRGVTEGYHGRYPYPEDGRRGSSGGRLRVGKAVEELASRITGQGE